ncbi:MAG: hypothetical protein JXA90_05785 [Planctomycetes bacterium]|nr:hypothetical protein [Planctomycetota bacterium]
MSRNVRLMILVAASAAAMFHRAPPAGGGDDASSALDLWSLARKEREVLAISTLFTAQNVRDLLASSGGLDDAVRWTKRMGVTRVFIESFRDSYRAQREVLERVRDRFAGEGLAACGCVTTTRIGKRSTGWDVISCYTDEATRKELASIFAFTASIFDEIMIDDFLFTDCACEKCAAARGERSWPEYRMALMNDLSRRDILGAARAVNPRVKLIIKYPQWYDLFHERGYDVERQTEMYDRIWVGTETRDPDSSRWGRKAQYEACFIMRWLGGIGGAKCGGGWFDPYGTSPTTYCEQARQTVIAGAREMLLFCYGSLLGEESRRNPEALRPEIPALFRLARWIQGGEPRGVIAVKPPSSHPAAGEDYIFDFIGMLGVPLVPLHAPPEKADALLVTSHLRHAAGWKEVVGAHLSEGRPVLATGSVLEDVKALAAARGEGAAKTGAVVALEWSGDPRSLMDRSAEDLAEMRRPILAALGLELDAPGRVALYLPARDVVALENFADRAASVKLTDRSRALQEVERIVLPPGAAPDLRVRGHTIEGTLPRRTLVVWKLAAAR